MSRKTYPVRLVRTAFGIRAQSLRALAKKAWWARRWMSSLEAMRLGPRMGRGRQYAVGGQVTELSLEGCHVKAVVVGSRPDPYHVTMDFTEVNAGGVVMSRIASEPMVLARLLTDDLPTEVEEWFVEEGVPLFPAAEPLGHGEDGRALYDVKMRCNCPDWARPCKHLAAVMLLLGEEIASRPATLLSLRGVDIDGMAPPTDVGDGDVSWTGEMARAGSVADPAALVKRLGAVPFWRGTARCVESLSRMYCRVGSVAVEAMDGRPIDLRRRN